MSGLFDLSDDPFGPATSKIAEGVIVSNPGAVSELISVVVPSLADDQALDKLRWTPRVESSITGAVVVLPVAGNTCLVVLTATGTAWVAAWWPY
jgi:hypothetical protein